MAYNISKINTFNDSIDEIRTVKIITKEMKKMRPPHYGGGGILICEGHVSQSTYGGLVILDTYKNFIKLKGWNRSVYPMLIMGFIVHEELHKTDTQKGIRKLVSLVKNGISISLLLMTTKNTRRSESTITFVYILICGW